MDEHPIMQYMDVNNHIPEHTELSDEEFEFARKYITKFGFRKPMEIEVPVVMIFPHTLSNMVIDIVRDYNKFKEN